MFSNVLTTKISAPLMVMSKILLLSSAIITLSGCKSGLSMKDDDTEKLLPSQQLADLETFGRVVTSVHPNLNFYDSELSFGEALTNCSERLNKQLSLGQFYSTISPVANVLKDEHTMIYSPQGSSISQQRRYADKIYSDIKSKETLGSNSYRILKESRLCVLKFNTCGVPWEHHLYKAFFERFFRDINEHKVDSLIIDIRRNQGGYSGNASELLRYIADAPFRQYDKAERRISQESLEFYSKCDINLIELLERDFDITELEVSEEGKLSPGTYVTEAKYVYPVNDALRFKGKTYVLIGPDVFSSGMLFANTVQCYKMAPLVGRQTRWKFGRQHLGDVIFGKLHHSHLVYMVSTTIFTVPRPPGVKSSKIIPDYKVPIWKLWTSKKTDAALNYAIKLSQK